MVTPHAIFLIFAVIASMDVGLAYYVHGKSRLIIFHAKFRQFHFMPCGVMITAWPIDTCSRI